MSKTIKEEYSIHVKNSNKDYDVIVEYEDPIPEKVTIDDFDIPKTPEFGNDNNERIINEKY